MDPLEELPLEELPLDAPPPEDVLPEVDPRLKKLLASPELRDALESSLAPLELPAE